MTATRLAAVLSILVAVALTASALAPPTPAAAPAPIFVRLGCSQCHAVSALDVRAVYDVAPDLTYAYGDVVTRYGMNLETFLAQPSGVMRLMLGAHLRLSPADRDSVVQALRVLYHERHADAADTAPPLGAPRP